MSATLQRMGRLALVALTVAAAGSFAYLSFSGGPQSAADVAPAATPPVAQPQPQAEQPALAGRAVARVLVATPAGRLEQPVQDAAAASLGGGLVLLGGLTAADTSTDRLQLVTAAGHRSLGRVPAALHDAGAATIGGAVYLFGGGDGLRQLDRIYRVDGRGRSTVAGTLPAPSSDQAAAAIGGAAYVVGGYTGTAWLDTIVRWQPGSPPRVVAHLPKPLRYAAVASSGGKLVIAGGSLPNGTASRAVLEFVPATGRLTQLGLLPSATTHAAAAALGGRVYVIGGRGAAAGTPTDQIVSVDPGSGRIRLAAQLPVALSDASAGTVNGRVLVAGGRSYSGTVSSVTALELRASAPKRTPTHLAAATPNVYAADGPNMLSAVAQQALPRIYVPNSLNNTVDVIDPATYRVVATFGVDSLPQHVTPAWDLKTLYVLNDMGNTITPVDPTTGKPSAPIPVRDPYNMYFTPDGRYAIVVAERLHRLDFRDAHTFKLVHSLSVPCAGVDHADFSADGSYLIASCEFSGQLLKIDVAAQRVTGVLRLPDGRTGMPQDVKLSPDGKVFYVADMLANGLWEVDGAGFKVTGFLRTGLGVHGLYPSRDARYLYATNRGEGTVSVISFQTRKVVKKWRLPGRGSPDMGGVSADGKVLWLSGRYDSVVYAISTVTGKQLARIRVGNGPHGLCVWPQPGRYSLGHTGILR